MRALAILGAMVSAWISGVGAASDRPSRNEGAAIFLLLSILCGVAAWWSK